MSMAYRAMPFNKVGELEEGNNSLVASTAGSDNTFNYDPDKLKGVFGKNIPLEEAINLEEFKKIYNIIGGETEAIQNKSLGLKPTISAWLCIDSQDSFS